MKFLATKSLGKGYYGVCFHGPKSSHLVETQCGGGGGNKGHGEGHIHLGGSFHFLEVTLEGKNILVFLDLLSALGPSLVSVLHLTSVLCSLVIAAPNLKRIP